jgi:outer membrane lipoprotein SlyB
MKTHTHDYRWFWFVICCRLLERRFDDPREGGRHRRAGGAAAGGIIGAAVGRPGAGAAIGGALGFGSGALVGDRLQGQEQKQSELQRQIDANQAELERQRRDLESLKKTGEY